MGDPQGEAVDALLRSPEITLERYRQVVETSADAISMTALDGRVLDINPGFTRITGYTRAEALGRTTPELGIWADTTARERMVDAVRATGVCETFETRFRTKDGRVFWGTFSARMIELGGTPYIVSIGRDIDDYRRSQDALRASEAKFKAVFEGAGDGILVLDPEGAIRDANRAAAGLLGRSVGELLGLPWISFVDAEGRGEARLRFDEGLQGEGSSFELGLVAPDEVLPTKVSLRRLVVEGEASVLVVLHDLSELHELQSQLLRRQRLEAVGQLASGVAHDFNNLLTVIRGVGELLQQDLEGQPEHVESLVEIDEAAVRAAELTRQLLAFSQRQVLQPRRVDLDALLTNLERMLRRLLPETVRLAVRLGAEPDTVRGDPGQLEQIVTNLVVNARDAIPGEGRIEVRTSTRRRDDTDFVVVEVEDDGEGMSPEIQARIFEPFFSTKATGRGVGLGLATVDGIVRQGGGFVDVTSTSGVGTTFSVGFPVYRGDRYDAPSVTPLEPTVLRGDETLLVAEDEPALRRLMVRTLRARGYRVLEAEDGQDALRVARRYAEPLHALVTDLVMPRLDGRRLAAALRHERPDVLVLYTSGYADRDLTEGLLDEPGTAFLPKVFTPGDLARAVRRLLDAAERRASG